MKLINAALKEKNVQSTELPVELRAEIGDFQTMVNKFNDACEEYEAEKDVDKDKEKKLDEMEDYIISVEKDIADKILAFVPVVQKTQEEIDAEAAAAAAAEATAAAEAAAAAEAEKKSGKDKKEDNSVGWLIFGGVVLVATMGLVNVLKKK